MRRATVQPVRCPNRFFGAPAFNRSVWWWCFGGGWLCFGSGDVMCCHVMWYDVMWLVARCHAMRCHVMWCDVMRCHVTWCEVRGDVMRRHVMWCDVMYCHVMWPDVMSCDLMCNDVMQWDGMLCGCDVMLLAVRSCDVMRCGCVMWWIGRWFAFSYGEPMKAKPLRRPFHCAVTPWDAKNKKISLLTTSLFTASLLTTSLLTTHLFISWCTNVRISEVFLTKLPWTTWVVAMADGMVRGTWIPQPGVQA